MHTTMMAWLCRQLVLYIKTQLVYMHTYAASPSLLIPTLVFATVLYYVQNMLYNMYIYVYTNNIQLLNHVVVVVAVAREDRSRVLQIFFPRRVFRCTHCRIIIMHTLCIDAQWFMCSSCYCCDVFYASALFVTNRYII